jgi:hypothetical protein
LGFKTVLGSLNDLADLEKLAAEFDIVFQTVSSWWIALVTYRLMRRNWGYRLMPTTSKGPKPF